MTDSSIHDAGFAGSPIMSYGEAPVKRRITKLLAVLAGSFAIFLVIFSLGFWFLTSMPIPNETVAMAVLPASVKLSGEAPEVWRIAVDANQPLPTVVGYAKDKDGKTKPFAIRVFLVSDLTNHFSAWNLLSGSELTSSSSKRPSTLIGSPFSSTARLTIWPKKLLNSVSGLGFDLPEVMAGPIIGKVWRVNGLKDDVQSLSSVTGTNAIALNPSFSRLLSNYLTANGKVVKVPENGLVNWKNDKTGLNLFVQPNTPIENSVYLDLAEGLDLFDYKSSLLEDETTYQILNPPISLSATSSVFQQTQFVYQLPAKPIIEDPNKSVRSLACSGEPLAVFDHQSLKNICSWTDICFFVPKQMIIAKQGDQVSFCVE